MVTVCQQCGDKGFYEALIGCEKCQTTAVHIYCLPVLPASFEDDVLWYCEDCEPKVAKPSTIVNPSSVLGGRCDSDSENLEIVQATRSNLRLKKNAVDRLSKNERKRNDSGSLAKAEVQKSGNSSSYLLQVHRSNNHEKDKKCGRRGELDGRSIYEEAESVKTKTSLATGGDSNSNSQYSRELLCNESDKNYEKLGRQIGLDGSSFNDEAESFRTRTSQVVTHDPPYTRECSSNAHKVVVIEVHSMGNDEKGYQFRRQRELVKNSSDTGTKSLKNSLVTTSHSFSIPKHSSNVSEKSIFEVQFKEDAVKDLSPLRWSGLNGGSSTEESESSKKETSLIASSRPSNIPEHCFVPAQPIIEPIWKGNLRLSSDKYGSIEGLVAHLSTSACSKVFQEAKLLPQLLCPELLPRSNAWPKSFHKWGPSDDNIALYLFPNNERSEKVYDSLVHDMISHDVALRAVVKNAELLLFTSNLLPFQFWRFQSKFYLWGVFRAKQASQSQTLAVDSLNAISISKPNGLVKALTRYPQSPASPLSNSGSHGSGSVHSCQSML
ncbi:hypothetical protein AB3S75_011531 [Citrus x aurantiifolia]